MLARTLITFSLLALPIQANAQQTPDYEQIIRDIIDGAPITAPTSAITTIPVTVNFDVGQPLDGYKLSLTALDENAEIVGQSVMRLDGLSAPITLPVNVTRKAASLSVITLRGTLDDPARQTTWQSGGDTVYSGAPIQMRLSKISTPQSDGQIQGFEQATGTVTLKNPSRVFAGAVLTVELIEEGLAGGTGSPIKGSTQVTITDPTRPVPFNMSFGVPAGGFVGALSLKATVRDWAGRVTHVMPNQVSYTGSAPRYQLTLDSFAQGAEVAPFSIETPPQAATNPQYSNTQSAGAHNSGTQIITPTDFGPPVNVSPPPMVAATLISSATFPAFRGLPPGATLNVTLWTPAIDGSRQVINRQAILLDGLSGDIDFAFPDAQVPAGGALYFDGDITTREGIRLFEANAQPTGAGYSLLRLSPLPAY